MYGLTLHCRKQRVDGMLDGGTVIQTQNPKKRYSFYSFFVVVIFLTPFEYKQQGVVCDSSNLF